MCAHRDIERIRDNFCLSNYYHIKMILKEDIQQIYMYRYINVEESVSEREKRREDGLEEFRICTGVLLLFCLFYFHFFCFSILSIVDKKKERK